MPELPYLKTFHGDHLTRIALPIGGIGTGTVSLGGRGNLRDWELMNQPAKGWTPQSSGMQARPSIVLSVADSGGRRVSRLMEGPLEHWEYEGESGSPVPNHGLPRFRQCSFDAGYPFGRVNLADDDVPLRAS
ncbi:MAG: GH116 family glycosyl-hydrolase, partial [Phycisphaeraceae bacterium]|nr:GH116 family glycosyl-hydrolase [Phycisphaeraceae bacterium]